MPPHVHGHGFTYTPGFFHNYTERPGQRELLKPDKIAASHFWLMKNFFFLLCLVSFIGCCAIQPGKSNKAKGNLEVLGLNVDRFCKEVGEDAAEKGCNERKFRKVGVSGGNKEDVGLKMVSLIDATDLATKKCKNVFENRAEDTPRNALELQAKLYAEQEAARYCERAS